MNKVKPKFKVGSKVYYPFQHCMSGKRVQVVEKNIPGEEISERNRGTFVCLLSDEGHVHENHLRLATKEEIRNAKREDSDGR